MHPPGRPRQAHRSSRWPAALGLVVLAALAWWTVTDLKPPPPVGADAAQSAFSAERALEHVEAIAQQPRPIGSANHERARAYLTDQLEQLGAEVEVHRGTGVSPFSGAVQYTASVHNVVALFPGTDSTGRVLLTAHYDSVPTSPGANDDAAGVAVTLEAARALTAYGPPRNDIVVLITDGEEHGLLGAEAFIHSHPLGQDGGILLNHEARGGAGAAMMFRASDGHPDLIRTLARVAPAPVADSAVADAFDLLPNETDFVVFDDAGFAAMDFAYADDSAIYHSALDTPENVSAESVQHMGANTLALAAEFSSADLAQNGNDTSIAYVNIPPGTLLVLPHPLLQTLGVAGLALAVAAVWRARRTGATSVPRIGLAVLASLGLVAAGAALAWAYWQVLILIRPGFADLLTQTPYRPVAFQAAMLVGILALGLSWYAALRRVLGAATLELAGVVVVTVLGAGAALLAPGSSVAFVLAGLLAALGLLMTGTGKRQRRPSVATAALVPTAVLVLPAAWLTFEMGLSISPLVVAPFAALGFLLLLPLLGALMSASSRRPVVLAVLALTAAVIASSAIGLVRNPLDAAQPVPVHLTYTLEADSGQAQWAVPIHPDRAAAQPAHPWLQALVEREEPDPTPGAWPDRRAHVGAAPPADLAPPQITVTGESGSGEERTLDLEISSPRGATGLHLVFDGPASQVVVGGRTLPEPSTPVEFHGLQPDASLTVQVHASATEPVQVRVADIDETLDGMAQLPGYAPHPLEIFLGHVRVSVLTSQQL